MVAGCFAPVGWQTSWLTSLRLAQKYPNFPKKKKLRKKCRKRISPFVLVHMGKVIFFSFSKLYPSPGGVQPKKKSRLPTDTSGWPMPNLVGIHPAVWPPNLNKRTNRQTDRQEASFYREELRLGTCERDPNVVTCPRGAEAGVILAASGRTKKWSIAIFRFLSAAQPTDQGTESVLLVVVVVGTHFMSTEVQFLGCVKQQTISEKEGRCENFSEKRVCKVIF